MNERRAFTERVQAMIGGFVAGVALVKLFEKRKLVTAKRAGHVLSRDEMGRWDPW